MIERADKLIVSLGYAPSRTLAQKLIETGKVQVLEQGIWRDVQKSSEKLDSLLEFKVQAHEDQRFVSRAGLKLEAAIDHLKWNVENMRAIDIGQSTGGFSDCLLHKGCRAVTGIEVGHGQLVDRLRDDARITCVEGLNARELGPEHVDGCFDLAVMDVSFISQTLILPRLPALLNPGGLLLSLVKPQFEVGPDGIGKKGLVKNVDLYQGVEEKITTLIKKLGFALEGYFDSAIQGGDGNREFFVAARLGSVEPT